MYTQQAIDALLQLERDDLNLREELQRKGLLHGGYNPQMEQLHIKNSIELERLIALYGFPTIPNASLPGHNAAWLVIQHAISRPHFMVTMLAQLRACDAQTVSQTNIAYLHDRICFYKRKLQRYGTQMDYDAQGIMGVWCVESPSDLDALRAGVFLPPIAQTLQSIATQRMPAHAAVLHCREMEAWLLATGWCTAQDIKSGNALEANTAYAVG